MGLLTKIALALAFLAAFAIPWLGATAHGAALNDGSVIIAKGAAPHELAEMETDHPADQPAMGDDSSGGMEEPDDDYGYEEPYPGEPFDQGQPDQGAAEPGSEGDQPAEHEGRD